jgi:hypothetical protein
MELYRRQRAERSEKTGVWGRKYDDVLTGPGCSVKAVMELYRRQRAERSEKTGVWGRIPQEVR